MGLAFKKAEKVQAKLRLALTGPSGAGKTFSALQIASGMGKRIAVVDTENHSAALYADQFDFDTLEIDPPYTVDKYLEAIRAAVAAGYEVF
jgi:type II secretory pathway predicted ATPase ExeA